MTVAAIPDAEKIVSNYLRTEVGERVVGKTPSSIADPWIRVTQLDAREPTGSRADHLIQFYLQFDCYAGAEGGQPEATALGRDVRKALVEMKDATHADAVVTGADIRSHARIPDAKFEKTRERIIITAHIYAHDA